MWKSYIPTQAYSFITTKDSADHDWLVYHEYKRKRIHWMNVINGPLSGQYNFLKLMLSGPFIWTAFLKVIRSMTDLISCPRGQTVTISTWPLPSLSEDMTPLFSPYSLIYHCKRQWLWELERIMDIFLTTMIVFSFFFSVDHCAWCCRANKCHLNIHAMFVTVNSNVTPQQSIELEQ